MIGADFKARTLTAAVVILIFVALLMGLGSALEIVRNFSFGIFLGLGILIVYELSKLGKLACEDNVSLITLMSLFLIPLLIVLIDPYCPAVSSQQIASVSWYLILVVAGMLGLLIGKNDLVYCIAYFRFLFPALLFLFGVTCFLKLLLLPDSLMPIIWISIVVAVNDTFAYIGGRMFGKHSLITSISPNKTIEGTATGVGLGLIAGFLSYDFFLGDTLWAIKLLICLAVLLAATIGDLLESYLKRIAGVKDSSNILPGHGGLLDRVDALMIAMPVMYFIHM